MRRKRVGKATFGYEYRAFSDSSSSLYKRSARSLLSLLASRRQKPIPFGEREPSAGDATMSTLSIAASSLVLPSFAPKAAVRYFALKPTSLSPLAVGLHLKSLSASPLFPSFDVAPRAAAPSRFLRRLAVSSDNDQEEEGEGGFQADDGGRSFSPDHKLVVGNLPFNFGSSQVAGLFESAGNVEMVEMIYGKLTGRSSGYGIVTMSSAEEVEAAARKFNGYIELSC